jgi:hypothetical protein
MCLCVIDRFEEWKGHTLDHNRPDVETTAALGSSQAARWLGLDVERGERSPQPAGQTAAERFFFGDVSTLETLRRR